MGDPNERPPAAAEAGGAIGVAAPERWLISVELYGAVWRLAQAAFNKEGLRGLAGQVEAGLHEPQQCKPLRGVAILDAELGAKRSAVIAAAREVNRLRERRDTIRHDRDRAHLRLHNAIVALDRVEASPAHDFDTGKLQEQVRQRVAKGDELWEEGPTRGLTKVTIPARRFQQMHDIIQAARALVPITNIVDQPKELVDRLLALRDATEKLERYAIPKPPGYPPPPAEDPDQRPPAATPGEQTITISFGWYRRLRAVWHAAADALEEAKRSAEELGGVRLTPGISALERALTADLPNPSPPAEVGTPSRTENVIQPLEQIVLLDQIREVNRLWRENEIHTTSIRAGEELNALERLHDKFSKRPRGAALQTGYPHRSDFIRATGDRVFFSEQEKIAYTLGAEDAKEVAEKEAAAHAAVYPRDVVRTPIEPAIDARSRTETLLDHTRKLDILLAEIRGKRRALNEVVEPTVSVGMRLIRDSENPDYRLGVHDVLQELIERS
jgi:hypothetical protein